MSRLSTPDFTIWSVPVDVDDADDDTTTSIRNHITNLLRTYYFVNKNVQQPEEKKKILDTISHVRYILDEAPANSQKLLVGLQLVVAPLTTTPTTTPTASPVSHMYSFETTITPIQEHDLDCSILSMFTTCHLLHKTGIHHGELFWDRFAIFSHPSTPQLTTYPAGTVGRVVIWDWSSTNLQLRSAGDWNRCHDIKKLTLSLYVTLTKRTSNPKPELAVKLLEAVFIHPEEVLSLFEDRDIGRVHEDSAECGWMTCINGSGGGMYCWKWNCKATDIHDSGAIVQRVTDLLASHSESKGSK